MSKRKRNVSFIKQDEPAFIARMKAQIGYKEGPTIETKRMASPADDGEEDIDHDDEQPQVVVMNEGDLTVEEAQQIQRLKDEGPADLNKRVVFRKPNKGTDAIATADHQNPIESENSSKQTKSEEKKKIRLSGKKNIKDCNLRTSLLSFDNEEESQ